MSNNFPPLPDGIKALHMTVDGHYLAAEYWLAVSDEIAFRGSDPTAALATAQVHATLAIPRNENWNGADNNNLRPGIVDRYTGLPDSAFTNVQEQTND